MKRYRIVVVGLLGVVALLVSAAAALAVHRNGDRTARCEARLAKVAERRGVSVAELEARIDARMLARVDAALRAGRISRERAAALRERIAAGELCASARVAPHGLRGRGLLRAAAAYLDLDRAELRAQLRGTSLAALATAQGKTLDGLQEAMLAAAETKLDRAVAAGRVTQARADRVLHRLERRIERLVQRVFPAHQ